MKLTAEDLVQVQETLKGIAFFDYLKSEELSALLDVFERHPFKRNDVLITQGKTGEVFYILEEGLVGVYQKRELLDRKIAELAPPSFFGEMSLISNALRSASVIALEDGVVLTLSRVAFREIILGNAHLAHLIRETARKREEETKEIERQERMFRAMNQPKED